MTGIPSEVNFSQCSQARLQIHCDPDWDKPLTEKWITEWTHVINICRLYKYSYVLTATPVSPALCSILGWEYQVLEASCQISSWRSMHLSIYLVASWVQTDPSSRATWYYVVIIWLKNLSRLAEMFSTCSNWLSLKARESHSANLALPNGVTLDDS